TGISFTSVGECQSALATRLGEEVSHFSSALLSLGALSGDSNCWSTGNRLPNASAALPAPGTSLTPTLGPMTPMALEYWLPSARVKVMFPVIAVTPTVMTTDTVVPPNSVTNQSPALPMVGAA